MCSIESGMSFLLVGQQPPGGGRDREAAEEVARHQVPVGELRLAVPFGETLEGYTNLNYTAYEDPLDASQGVTAGLRSAGRVDMLAKEVAAEVQRRIGFAMQEVGMDELATAREMLVLHAQLYGMPKREAQRKAEELLATFDLAEHADRRVTRFSGGMQRRLDLAVSLIHTPEVLFLDEPSTGLDPKSRSDLWRVLRRLQEKGITMLLSTHYMEEADELCDRIAIVHQGRIAAIDTPESLKRSVGSDTVRVSLGQPPSDRQRRDLERAFGAHNLSFADGAMDIRVKDGSKALLPALQVLAGHGISVKETRVLTPTLEDVFLQYTGARFAEAAASAAKAEGAA